MIQSLWHYYSARARIISQRDNHLEKLPDPETWDIQRAQIHRQLMISLGLENQPDRCDLSPNVTGRFRGEGYTAEKLTYQLLPQVWGSAHLFFPDDLSHHQPAPAVLYTCGHHLAGVEGYHHHAVGWARRGYVCLIFDTIEQHDNPGDHHGLHSGRSPEWISLGYTAAGGEVFNGMRALDLLLEQPRVDAKRIGVTGLSGGGAQSFLLAAADQRLCAVATVAGVSDPAFAIPNRHVANHCDCMYPHNRFARDVSVWASLIAPRPLLFAYARHDVLYTPEEFRAIHRHSQDRYANLGVRELCMLEEYDGQHGYNHKSTIDCIHRWFDHHVAGDSRPQIDTLKIKESGQCHDEVVLSVSHGSPPQPNYLHILPEFLSRRGQVRLPQSSEEWATIKAEAVETLRCSVFQLLEEAVALQELSVVADSTHEGRDRVVWQGAVDAMEQRVVMLSAHDGADRHVLVCIGDRRHEAATLAKHIDRDVQRYGVATIGIVARGAGRTAPHPSQRNILNREGCLVGMTPLMLMIQDLHYLMPRIKALPGVGDRSLYLYGQGEGAMAMLYYALLNDVSEIGGIILEDLPRSHEDSEHQILGICRVMDLSQSIGLLAPAQVRLVQPNGAGYDRYWASRVYKRLRCESNLVIDANFVTTIGGLFRA